MMMSTAVAVMQGARILVQGSEGTLSAPQPGFNPPSNGVVYGAKAEEGPLQEHPMPAKYVPFEDDRDDRLMAFRLLLREFERGMRDGVSPGPSFTDGLRCQEVLAAVRASSASGQRVALA